MCTTFISAPEEAFKTSFYFYDRPSPTWKSSRTSKVKSVHHPAQIILMLWHFSLEWCYPRKSRTLISVFLLAYVHSSYYVCNFFLPKRYKVRNGISHSLSWRRSLISECPYVAFLARLEEAIFPLFFLRRSCHLFFGGDWRAQLATIKARKAAQKTTFPPGNKGGQTNKGGDCYTLLNCVKESTEFLTFFVQGRCLEEHKGFNQMFFEAPVANFFGYKKVFAHCTQKLLLCSQHLPAYLSS